MTVFKGINGQVELTSAGITIRRKGAMGFLTQGLKGEKRIPFESISAIQFKNPGMLTSGYIQFSIVGGVEARGGLFDATKDENTVMFNKGAQATEFVKLRDFVEGRLAEIRRPAAAQPAQSVADELGKLADLQDRGILSQAEFEEQKRAVLARGRP